MTFFFSNVFFFSNAPRQLVKMNIDKLLERIAQDCIDDNRVRQKGDDQQEFTAEQCQRYRELDEDFWGGYAYLDEGEEVSGFIRLYSPWGDAKWSFFFKDGELIVC